MKLNRSIQRIKTGMQSWGVTPWLAAVLVAAPALSVAAAANSLIQLQLDRGDVIGAYHGMSMPNASDLKAKFRSDAIVVRMKGDAEPFRAVGVPAGKSVTDLVREYRNRSDVEYAEPDYVAEALFTPNDTYYPIQWNFQSQARGGVQADQAWDTTKGAGVTIAVVDTGIAYENYGTYRKAPDLANTCFTAGYDFVNRDAHPNDDNSHGTHVAGTLAESTNNASGVAGIAFASCLMPVKVLDRNGSGSYTTVANGIYFAVDHGAKVINMSLGGSASSATLQNAVKYAYDHGVTVVAAAGNDGTSAINYPAAYDQYVIAVGATRVDKTKTSYSDYGPSLDVVAPGGDLSVDQNGDGYPDGILQNTFNPMTRNPRNFGYWFFEGTSMATPHVAAVAALVVAHGNATTPDQVRTAIQSTAVDLGAAGRDDTYGWGLVNATSAVNWAPTP